MVTGATVRKDLFTFCAEVRAASIAPKMVVLALLQHDAPAAWALTSLVQMLTEINELRQEASLLGPSLCAINMMDLLIPSTDLFVIEESALTGCEVVISIDFLVAAPAKRNFAVGAHNFAATLRFLYAYAATRAILGYPCQVPDSQQLLSRQGCFVTNPGGTALQGSNAVIGRCTLRPWMVHALAAAAEDEEADSTPCHVVLVFDARDSLRRAVRIAAGTEYHVLHPVQAIPEG